MNIRMSNERTIIAIVQDAMSLLMIPGGSIAGLTIENLFSSRAKAAREILLEELRSGRTTLDDAEVEETVAILERYLRAAKEGTARLNLRLMAKVIAGQKESRALTASEFLYYADMLASLRRDEIILLATIYKTWASHEGYVPPNEAHRMISALSEAQNQLIPSVFSDTDMFIATAGAITRTGLLIGSPGDGLTLFKPSPLMDKLYALAPFEAALSAETA